MFKLISQIPINSNGKMKNVFPEHTLDSPGHRTYIERT